MAENNQFATSPVSPSQCCIQPELGKSTETNIPKFLPLSEIQNIATHVQPPTIPPHRSHDPSNNLKRSEPFQFGSRYLEENDNVFEFNAWDSVDPSTDALYTTYTAHQYEFQRQHAVSAFDRIRFNNSPEKWWDKFYSNNASNFFKDRKWLRQEFPILDDCTCAPNIQEEAQDRTVDRKRRNVILEVGAGAGNTAFPILAGNQNPNLIIHACDFSKKAVQIIRENPAYDGRHIRAEVWDVASTAQTLPPGVEPGSVDVVFLIFIFSALNPLQWGQAVRNVWQALRPGGEVCFRDYGRGDLAQVRFKKGRWLGENFYVRGDGTRVYFFAEDELRTIWGGIQTQKTECSSSVKVEVESNDERGRDTEHQAAKAAKEEVTADSREDEKLEESSAFEILGLGADRRLLVNRQKQLKMYRCWMQGRFRKAESSATSAHSIEAAPLGNGHEATQYPNQ